MDPINALYIEIMDFCTNLNHCPAPLPISRENEAPKLQMPPMLSNMHACHTTEIAEVLRLACTHASVLTDCRTCIYVHMGSTPWSMSRSV